MLLQSVNLGFESILFLLMIEVWKHNQQVNIPSKTTSGNCKSINFSKNCTPWQNYTANRLAFWGFPPFCLCCWCNNNTIESSFIPPALFLYFKGMTFVAMCGTFLCVLRKVASIQRELCYFTECMSRDFQNVWHELVATTTIFRLETHREQPLHCLASENWMIHKKFITFQI